MLRVGSLQVWALNAMQAGRPGPHKGSFHGAGGPGVS